MKLSQPSNPLTSSDQEAFDTLIAAAEASLDETTPPPTGRDAKGRFTKQNPGGPGNPFACQVAKLRSALVNTVTEADIQCIAKELILRARRGNLAAMRLLFHYVLGKPAQTVNPDTIDLEEGQQIVRPIPQILKELPEALMSLPVETADEIAGTTQQAVGNTLTLPQQVFEKVSTAIAMNEPEGQESAEGERCVASLEEGSPSPNGVRKPEETLAGPSPNGGREPAETATEPSPNGVREPAETAACPSPNGVREPAETAACPSPIGGFGRARSLLWLAKIAATARLASERVENGQRLGA